MGGKRKELLPDSTGLLLGAQETMMISVTTCSSTFLSPYLSAHCLHCSDKVLSASVFLPAEDSALTPGLNEMAQRANVPEHSGRHRSSVPQQRTLNGSTDKGYA
eukprot:2636463-Rhodomonas_salina.1